MRKPGAILLLAICVRLLVPLGALAVHGNPDVFRGGDTRGYLEAAASLVTEGRFARNERHVELERTPGYSLLLIPGVLTGRPYLVAIALQILIGTISVWGVYLLGRRLETSGIPRFSEDIAALAALLYALDPLSILYPSLLLTETLFAILFIAHLYSLLLYMETRALRFVVLAGALAAASTFVRPIAYYWPFLAGALLLYGNLRERRIVVHRAVAATVLVAVAMTPCALWQVRNTIQEGYRGFAAVRDVNLYSHLGASVLAETEGRNFTDVKERLERHLDEQERLHAWTIAQRFDYMRQEGLRVILSRPIAYFWIHVRGMVDLLFDTGKTEFLELYGIHQSGSFWAGIASSGVVSTVISAVREQPIVLIASVVFRLILTIQLCLAGVGMIRILPRISAATCLLLGSAAYFLAISGGPTAYSRFRHPIMPVVCVLAAIGVASLHGRWRRSRTR